MVQNADLPVLLVYVDAEEEFDWAKPFSSSETSVTNILEQDRIIEQLNAFDIQPTYLVDYPVANAPEAVAALAPHFKAERIGLGSQLHPWVTPPFEETVGDHASFPGNLSADLEQRKLVNLTDKIEASFGHRPYIYRAGRYGLGPHTAATLEALNYTMDCSVYAGRNFADLGGLDYLSSSPHPFWKGPTKSILEIPLTGGFLGALRSQGASMARLVDSPIMRSLHVPSMLRFFKLFDRSWISPEGVPIDEAKQLTRQLYHDGVRVFSLSFHSPSVVPGLTPYVRDAADLTAFFEWIEQYLIFFFEEFSGRGSTPDEIYAHFKNGRPITPAALKAG